MKIQIIKLGDGGATEAVEFESHNAWFARIDVGFGKINLTVNKAGELEVMGLSGGITIKPQSANVVHISQHWF